MIRSYSALSRQGRSVSQERAPIRCVVILADGLGCRSRVQCATNARDMVRTFLRLIADSPATMPYTLRASHASGNLAMNAVRGKRLYEQNKREKFRGAVPVRWCRRFDDGMATFASVGIPRWSECAVAMCRNLSPRLLQSRGG
jgi:hypothetical protein